MPTADGGLVALPPVIDWLEASEPPVEPPSLAPCPEGWSAEVVGDGDPVTCAPYPAGGPEECADGWAHFTGEPGCTPVGAPCPVGDFPAGLPSDAPLLYVLAGAAPGGDGSESAPLRSIGEAMGRASAGTVIALGKGVYDEAVYLGAGVTLWGACARETRLTATTPSLVSHGVVQVFGPDSRLQNVRIGPADIPGLVAVGSRALVAVEGLLIEATRIGGLVAMEGGRVVGQRVCVSDTRADSTGQHGYGVHVWAGSTVELTRAVVARNRDLGVFAWGAGASVTLRDAAVRDTESRESDGAFGRGLGAQLGATVEVSRAVFSRNRGAALYVTGAATRATLSDLVVRDTRSREIGRRGGRGLNAQGGATVEVSRAVFARNREIGIFVTGEGTSVTMSDVVVRDTQGGESDGRGGRGLNVEPGATVEVSRAVFARNRDVGVVVAGQGTSAALTDVVVRDTADQESDGTGGRGLNVQQGATVEVNRTVFTGGGDVGVLVAGEGASVGLTDVVVRDTKSRESDGHGGRGLSVQAGAAAELSRVLFAHNHDSGILAMGAGTSLIANDLVVRDTESRESDGEGGRGLGAQEGATAEVNRALFARNREVGVAASSSGTTVRLWDVVVAETMARSCATTTCPDHPFGLGLGIVTSSVMTVSRFEVRDSALCGVFLAAAGELDLSEGRVAGSPIGVCLQVDDYMVNRLTTGVRYGDNDTNLDATRLPLPEVGEPLDPSL